MKTIWLTWAGLMGLLTATWLAAQVNLGVGNTVVALLISGTKMFLIILFFMEARKSSKLIWIFAGAGFVWLLIMITLTLSDYLTRTVVKGY